MMSFLLHLSTRAVAWVSTEVRRALRFGAAAEAFRLFPAKEARAGATAAEDTANIFSWGGGGASGEGEKGWPQAASFGAARVGRARVGATARAHASLMSPHLQTPCLGQS